MSCRTEDREQRTHGNKSMGTWEGWLRWAGWTGWEFAYLEECRSAEVLTLQKNKTKTKRKLETVWEQREFRRGWGNMLREHAEPKNIVLSTWSTPTEAGKSHFCFVPLYFPASISTDLLVGACVCKTKMLFFCSELNWYPSRQVCILPGIQINMSIIFNVGTETKIPVSHLKNTRRQMPRWLVQNFILRYQKVA